MIAAAIAKHLEGLGLVEFDADGVTGDAFIATMPSAPDEAVAITPTGGNPQPTRAAVDLPVVQVRVRSARFDPRPGYERARDIYGALTCLDNVTLDDGGDDEVRVIGCTAIQSDPAPLGADENDRQEWVVNYALRTVAPTLHRT